MTDEKPPLSIPHVQSALLSETVRNADVGFLVWDDDRRFVAGNPCACALLGCTIEELVASGGGEGGDLGPQIVEKLVQAGEGGPGEVDVSRLDDGTLVRVGYVSFATRIAGVPYMASIIWPSD